MNLASKILLCFFLTPFWLYSQLKVDYEKVDVNILRSSQKGIINKVLIIRSNEDFKNYFINSDSLFFDFKENILIFCCIDNGGVLACEKLVELKLINEALQLTVHHIGENADRRLYVVGFKLKKDLKINKASLDFINYGHGSKVWADSLCNSLKKLYEK